MTLKLAFHGAARTVTGSKYLIRADGDAALVDCGTFQGLKELRLRNWDKPAFDATSIRWVILTHAHTDHSAFLPRLYKYGFRGQVLCSEPTARLAEILLLDAAHLHEEDAHFLNKEKATKHTPALPFFTVADAKAALTLFRPVPFHREVRLTPRLSFTLRPVGHILGASSVLVRTGDPGRLRTIYFGGDIGRYDMPLLPDPLPPVNSDYLVLESTYGDRLHETVHPADTLAELVRQIVETKGILLIPAFAVGRVQELVLVLRRLEKERSIPRIPIHVDSPMAADATEIFCAFPGLHRLDLSQLGDTDCALHGANITYHRTREESKAINKLNGPRIIIAPSGMLTGGRVLHHLIQRMGRSENIIALAGFQAAGTRGRDLLEGKHTLRIHGREREVKARVVDIGGLSAHADYAELMRWLEPLTPPPQTTFVTHGEPGPAEAMATRVAAERGFRAVIPSLGDEVEL